MCKKQVPGLSSGEGVLGRRLAMPLAVNMNKDANNVYDKSLSATFTNI